jgi:hypothetical protein
MARIPLKPGETVRLSSALLHPCKHRCSQTSRYIAALHQQPLIVGNTLDEPQEHNLETAGVLVLVAVTYASCVVDLDSAAVELLHLLGRPLQSCRSLSDISPVHLPAPSLLLNLARVVMFQRIVHFLSEACPGTC